MRYQKVSKYDENHFWYIQSALFILYMILFGFTYIFAIVDVEAQSNILITETKEWSLNYIQDMITATPKQCDSYYDRLTYYFLGTQDWCLYNNGEYAVDRCELNGNDSITGTNMEGMSEQEIYQIDNVIICYKRSRMNYHQIVHSRASNLQCESTQQVCGSTNESSEKTYCIDSGQQCPINFIDFSTNSSTGYTQFGTNYYYQLNTNQDFNPMARLYISLSQPCGDVTQIYQSRETKISEFYEEGSCNFNLKNATLQTSFTNTSFEETEYEVYYENDLLTNIQTYLPQGEYFADDLLLNTYTIYVKPYAQWKTACQEKYSTSAITSQVANLSSTSTHFNNLYIFTIIHTSFLFLNLFMIIGTFCQGKKCKTIFINVTLILSILFIILMELDIFFIVYAYVSLNVFESGELRFIIDNECSDILVNEAFNYISDTISDYLLYFILCLVLNAIITCLQVFNALVFFRKVKYFQKIQENQEQLLGSYRQQNQVY